MSVFTSWWPQWRTLPYVPALKVTVLYFTILLLEAHYYGLRVGILGGLVALFSYKVNEKGFGRLRLLERYGLLLLGISAVIVLVYLTQASLWLMLPMAFAITFIATFVSSDQKIAGLGDYIPLLFVMLLGYTMRHDFGDVQDRIAASAWSLMASALYSLFTTRDLHQTMGERMQTYVDLVAAELLRHVQGQEPQSEKTREAYTAFLQEYYKGSQHAYATTPFGKDSMSLVLVLHFFMEFLRRSSMPEADKRTLAAVLQQLLTLPADRLPQQPETLLPEALARKHGYVLGQVVGYRRRLEQRKDVTYWLLAYKAWKRYDRQSIWYFLRANLRVDSFMFRNALMMGVLMTISFAITYFTTSPVKFWLPLTVMLVARPYYQDAVQRILQRIVGTLLGSLLGMGIALLLPVGPAYYAVVGICMYLGMLFVVPDYRLAVMFITAFVVLLNVRNYEMGYVLATRVFDTLLGGGLVFVVTLGMLHSEVRELHLLFRQLLGLQYELVGRLYRFNHDQREPQNIESVIVDLNLQGQQLTALLQRNDAPGVCELMGLSTHVVDLLTSLFIALKGYRMRPSNEQALLLLQGVWQDFQQYLRDRDPAPLERRVAEVEAFSREGNSLFVNDLLEILPEYVQAVQLYFAPSDPAARG